MPLKVMVKWHDARLCPGSYTNEEAISLKMAIFESIGYLILKDAATTIIASEQDNEGQFRAILLIPTGSILSIRRLFLGSFM